MDTQQTFDDYLDKLNQPERTQLERIRTIVKGIVPDVQETFGYGMPVFKYKGKYLIGMSAFKNHMSIFPGSEPIALMQDKLKDFKLAKGTVQFTLDKPIPEPLLKQIIRSCFERVSLS